MRYDWECREVLGRTDQDVGFWLEVVSTAPAGRVLELACGTGRVTIPLAAAGIEIVGIDIDATMLMAARTRGAGRMGERLAPRPPLLAADMRRFALAARFGAAIVPYNSIQLLTEEADVAACLACVAAHLSPGGVVGLEVTDFQAGAVETEVAAQPIHGGSLGGRPLTLSGSLTHDLGSRISRYRRQFRGPGWTVEDEVVIRSHRQHELAAMMTAARMPPERWWQEGRVTRVVGRRVGEPDRQ
jgi:SAM-dependent methyltransferase